MVEIVAVVYRKLRKTATTATWYPRPTRPRLHELAHPLPPPETARSRRADAATLPTRAHRAPVLVVVIGWSGQRL